MDADSTVFPKLTVEGEMESFKVWHWVIIEEIEEVTQNSQELVQVEVIFDWWDDDAFKERANSGQTQLHFPGIALMLVT